MKHNKCHNEVEWSSIDEESEFVRLCRTESGSWDIILPAAELADPVLSVTEEIGPTILLFLLERMVEEKDKKHKSEKMKKVKIIERMSKRC